MKTSNIIVVSLIASITLLITMGMMEFRIKGVPRGSVAHKPLRTKQTSLPEFHFVVVQDCRNVLLDISEGFNLEVADLPDSVNKLSCQVQNDTLYIKGLLHPEQGDFVTVKAPAQQIKMVRALNSQIIVTNFPLDQFAIRLDGSTASLNAQQAINTLIIEGVNNSRIDVQSSSMTHTLDLTLEHSEIYTFGALGKLKGSIKDQSRAQLKEVAELTFTKDGTSHLQVWSE